MAGPAPERSIGRRITWGLRCIDGYSRRAFHRLLAGPLLRPRLGNEWVLAAGAAWWLQLDKIDNLESESTRSSIASTSASSSSSSTRRATSIQTADMVAGDHSGAPVNAARSTRNSLPYRRSFTAPGSLGSLASAGGSSARQQPRGREQRGSTRRARPAGRRPHAQRVRYTSPRCSIRTTITVRSTSSTR